jgi:sensor histidine kinase YesM
MATYLPVVSGIDPGVVTLVSAMERYPFIFSNQPGYRFQRHFVFWVSWWLFQSVLYSFSALILQFSYFKRLPVSTLESLVYLLPHMFLAYTLMYWVVPKLLLKGKYGITAIAVCLLFIATALISSVIGIYALQPVRVFFFGPDIIRLQHPGELYLFPALMAGLRGAITIGGMATSIKLMKYWYMKEQRNLQLQRENVAAQMQLLKAQVHPHFLFNTLNNIYSYTQNTSATASKLVMGLSDLLRYMLYECNQPLVPLNKELKMLQDYIVLEQIRYNHQLEVTVDLPDDAGNYMIAPLLLLPFVENAFKHGTSQMLEQPWISLSIFIEDDQLKMKLVNGKAEQQKNSTGGIGIDNVRKRLELLYPNQHLLRTSNEEHVFVVSLRLQLDKNLQTKETRQVAVMSHD